MSHRLVDAHARPSHRRSIARLHHGISRGRGKYGGDVSSTSSTSAQRDTGAAAGQSHPRSATFATFRGRPSIALWPAQIAKFTSCVAFFAGKKWEASVARCLPNRWNPLLLPGGVRPRFCLCKIRPLGRQLRSNCERLIIVGTCVMSRCGGLIPVGNRGFTTFVDPISPPSATARLALRGAPLVVEAPGYCPPGPKCLFHATVYRHSRLPGMT